MACGHHDTSVRSQDYVNLILKETQGEQVSFESVFCSVNRFLVGGITEDDHHQQADNH